MFIETNHRNPIPEQALASFQWQATRSSAPTRSLSKHRIEEHNMLNWLKANRKALNAGKMKAERVEKLTIVDFRHDSTMFERTRHCARCSESLENFWK